MRILTDEDLDRLADDYVRAAVLAQRAGFQFVDVKHCHGYLGHELLAAHDRPGRYGGSLENRTRLLRTIVEGIRAEAPGLRIGVRFSAFDTVPWRQGRPAAASRSRATRPTRRPSASSAASGWTRRSARAAPFLRLLHGLGIRWACVSAGSPYYNPHVQRPALFPPSDGYLPPEDPLVGVARQVRATALLKSDAPGLVLVGSAYSYLQEWLPNVGQRVVREGQADFVGLGRMVLSYPDLPADVLAGRPLERKKHLPDLQRLHDRPAQGAPLGVLSSRPVLRRPARSRSAEGGQGSPEGMTSEPETSRRRDQALAVATAFFALFSIVGIALYGLPFFYDFFVRDLGWTRQQVTSGNALSKLVVGPLFGFFAGMFIDRFGPRRLMLAGILVAGTRPRRPRGHHHARRLLRVLPDERRRERVRRAPPEPGAALGLVRRRPRQGHGRRLPRDRHRRHARAADGPRARGGLRLADGPHDPRRR